MCTFTARVTRHSFNNPSWYQIYVNPSASSGGSLYRDFRTYDAFGAALIRLGIAAENVPAVVRELENDGVTTLFNLSLSVEDATYFGWPSR
jgi:hypothetical protein